MTIASLTVGNAVPDLDIVHRGFIALSLRAFTVAAILSAVSSLALGILMAMIPVSSGSTTRRQTDWATLIGYNATLSTPVITSTLRTTTVIVTVLATDSADASISFDNFSASSTDTIPSTVTDSPSATPSETSLSEPESSDRDTVDQDPGPSGADDTGGGAVVVRPPFGVSRGGLFVFVGMVMPLWMALYL
ncbi:hypothetical protein BJX61DRAFT_544016 [Aspergillus egyptiacus]|nr:hypothetical protein BJX61DRAFT_544016 [Aspergillus egyptiacus]